MKTTKKKIDTSGEISLGNDTPLSLSIAAALGKTSPEPPPPPSAHKSPTPPPTQQPDAATFLATLQQATLHRESAGRGGRVVTIMTAKPAPTPKTAEALAKNMRKGLGCGAHVENAKIVLHGDIQKRAEQWLAKEGVKKIVMGN